MATMKHQLPTLATLMRRYSRGLLVLAVCLVGTGSLGAWHAVDLAVHEGETACEICLGLTSNNNAALAAPGFELVVVHDAASATAPTLPLVRAASRGVAIRAPPALMN